VKYVIECFTLDILDSGAVWVAHDVTVFFSTERQRIHRVTVQTSQFCTRYVKSACDNEFELYNTQSRNKTT